MAFSLQAWYKKWFAQWPWFALLLPLSFVIHGYVKYPDFISSYTLMKLIGQYVITILAVAALVYLFLKNWVKALMVGAMVLAFNFYWGLIHDFLLHRFGNAWFTRQLILWPVIGIAFMGWIRWLKRSAPVAVRTLGFLNLLLLLFILIDAGSWLMTKKKSRTSSGITMQMPPPLPDNVSKPDIYLIVLDEYAGRESLIKGMNFDNADFLNALRARGFFVADSSRANYNATLYAMASIFSLQYMDLTGQDSSLVADPGVAFQAIYDNRLADMLHRQGYRVLNNSWFRINHAESMDNPSYGPSEEAFINAQTLVSRFTRNSLLSVARQLGWEHLQRSLVSENEIYNSHVLNNLEKAARDKQAAPRFVYTHLSMPHFPYFRDKTGRPYSTDSLMNIVAENQTAYLEYLQYASKTVLRKIDVILKEARTPFQLILLSDHGYRRMAGVSFEEAAFSNLFAAYASDGNTPDYSQHIYNANVFPLLLNDQFNWHIPVLQDSSFRVKF